MMVSLKWMKLFCGLAFGRTAGKLCLFWEQGGAEAAWGMVCGPGCLESVLGQERELLLLLARWCDAWHNCNTGVTLSHGASPRSLTWFQHWPLGSKKPHERAKAWRNHRSLLTILHRWNDSQNRKTDCKSKEWKNQISFVTELLLLGQLSHHNDTMTMTLQWRNVITLSLSLSLVRIQEMLHRQIVRV